MKDIRKICIVYNLKSGTARDDSEEEYDEIETVRGIKAEIEEKGFKVTLLEQDGDFLGKIQRDAPDFVFNIAEGKGRSRSRESQIPCMLESLGIPYSGSDPVSLGLSLDKYLTNLVLKAKGIPVPAVYLIESPDRMDHLREIFDGRKRFILKPRWEGSSKGIFTDSVIADPEAMKRKARELLSRYAQPVIAEEFMEKDEITAGVYGNEAPRLLGMMRIVPRDGKVPHFVYSIDNKRDWEKKIKYEPARTIPPDIRDLVEKYSLAAFRALELRDVARIDFRLDRDGVPKIIDVNPLPGLSERYSDLVIMYRLAGGDYPDLISKILSASLNRSGIKLQAKQGNWDR